MNDYFSSIEVNFFNKDFYSEVNKIADNILLKIHTPENILVEYEYTEHTNIMFYDGIINQIPSLHKFISSLNANVVAVPLLAFVPPMKTMGIHTDEYGCFTKILLPIKGKDPLYFYKTLDDTIPDCTFTPEINSPIIFNTNKPHGGVKTNNEWRVNFQIMLSNSFDVILDRSKNNSLFLF